MSTTVDIIIKGVAIGYKKGNDWHVLFPIDDEGCHNIYFSHRKNDEKNSKPAALAKAAKPIIITTFGASSTTGETNNFSRFVLDLTSSLTHPSIKMKGNLEGKAVLMTIANARFSIVNYLQDFPGEIPPLIEVSTGQQTPITEDMLIAHSVKATITLNDNGQVMIDNDLPGGKFTTEAGNYYTLTFDNDCDGKNIGKNDMDMFYQVVEEDSSAPERHFRIGDAGDQEVKKDPPNYAQGKPCLFVKVSNPNDLP